MVRKKSSGEKERKDSDSDGVTERKPEKNGETQSNSGKLSGNRRMKVEIQQGLYEILKRGGLPPMHRKQSFKKIQPRHLI